MTQPNLQHQVTYSLPLGDLLALGKALYLADPASLAEKGLTEEDAEAVQRVFEAVDEGLEGWIGLGWLGDLEDKAGEIDGDVTDLITDLTPTETPFLKLVRNMK